MNLDNIQIKERRKSKDRLSSILDNYGSKQGILKRPDSKSKMSKKVSFFGNTAIEDIQEFDENEEAISFNPNSLNYMREHEIKEIESDNESGKYSVKRMTINLSDKKKDNINNSIRNHSLVNQQISTIEEKNEVLENTISPDKPFDPQNHYLRANRINGSIQKMRATLAGFKKPIIPKDPLINNIKDNKAFRRESMPNFFANVVVTDEDVERMDEETNNIKKENKEASIRNDQSIETKDVLNQSFDINLMINNLNNSILNDNEDQVQVAVLSNDQEVQKSMEVFKKTIQEELFSATKDFNLIREENKRISNNIRSEIETQIKSNNTQLSTIIEYTNQQIFSRKKEIEEETARKEFYINKNNQIIENIRLYSDTFNQYSNELANINDKKSKLKAMLKLSLLFKNLGLNLTINEEVNKISFQFMNFYKFTFVCAFDSSYHTFTLLSVDFKYIEKCSHREMLSQIIAKLIKMQFTCNNNYFIEEFAKLSIKELIKSISPISYFFYLVLPIITSLYHDVQLSLIHDNPLSSFITESIILHIKLKLDDDTINKISIDFKINISTLFSENPLLIITHAESSRNIRLEEILSLNRNYLQTMNFFKKEDYLTDFFITLHRDLKLIKI